MIPGGAVAAAFLLSLIPGALFLRRTESVRQPRNLSALQEVLELLGVGLLTTGVVIGVALLVDPGLLLNREFPTQRAREVRVDVALAVALLLGSLALAEFTARMVRRKHPAPESELNIGTWWSVMRPELVPDGHLPYVAVQRSDGVTVQGVLHNYTLSPDVTHRDVALKKPIKFVEPHPEGGKSITKSVPYDFVVIPGTEIRHLALVYQPRSGPGKAAPSK